MALPMEEYPQYTITIPSNKTKVIIRPYRVKEEKILLTAKQGKNLEDILMAINQIVKNCIITSGVYDNLSLFDIEYIFLRLRAISVDNISKVSYQDNEDNKVYDFDIDLNTIEVRFPENMEKHVKINDKLSLELGYPPATLYSDMNALKASNEKLYDILLSKCITKVFDGEKVYDLRDFSVEDVTTFIDNLSITAYNKVKHFFNNLPQMEYIVEYTNSRGTERKITLSTLDDFFILD